MSGSIPAHSTLIPCNVDPFQHFKYNTRLYGLKIDCEQKLLSLVIIHKLVAKLNSK